MRMTVWANRATTSTAPLIFKILRHRLTLQRFVSQSFRGAEEESRPVQKRSNGVIPTVSDVITWGASWSGTVVRRTRGYEYGTMSRSAEMLANESGSHFDELFPMADMPVITPIQSIQSAKAQAWITTPNRSGNSETNAGKR